MRRALYIGRFQVFHRGHLDVVQTIDAEVDVDETLIAIGSTQYDHTRKSPVAPWWVNPFTVAERHEMIEGSLAGKLNKPWSVHEVPDYHDWELWFAHIAQMLPASDILYSTDPHEHAFFSMKGYETRRFERIFDFHAGALRKAMAAGEPWHFAVPEASIAVLERIDAPARMRAMLARDAQEAADV